MQQERKSQPGLWPQTFTNKQGVRCQGCNRKVFTGWVTKAAIPYCRACYHNNRKPDLPALSWDNTYNSTSQQEK